MAAIAAAPARATNALRRIFTTPILTNPNNGATGDVGLAGFEPATSPSCKLSSATPTFHVGLAGFEPATSPLSGVRSNRLSYSPKAKPSGKPTFGGSRQANEFAEDGGGVAGELSPLR